MAILGGDIRDANNPLTIDTLEDLKTILNDTSYIPVPVSGSFYIAFPEVYDGPKVIDLRRRGWNPVSIIRSFGAQGNSKNYINIYFNGWTILGLSIVDSNFIVFSIYRTSTSGDPDIYIRIYDLTIKNAYLIANNSNANLLWKNQTEFACGSSIELYRCKISAVLDVQRSGVQGAIFRSTQNSRATFSSIEECSFNITVVNNISHTAIPYVMICENGSNPRITVRNSIVYIKSSRYLCASSSPLLQNVNPMFCKFMGVIRWGNETDESSLSLINAVIAPLYNVLDFNLEYAGTSTGDLYVYVTFSSGINVVNTSNTDPGIASSYVWQPTNATLATTAQIQDAQWLNDHYFVVGDPPTDT